MLDEKTSRDFVNQTHREHEALRRLLGQIRQMVAQRSESVDRVAEMLTSLGEHLETHFRHEEAGGLFEQVPAHEPRLSERADQLRQQHAGLHEQVGQLARWARENGASTDWWEEIEKRYHQFSKELMHHESQENALLQEAYGQDIGSQD